MDVEVEDVAAELWAKQLGSGRGGAAGRAQVDTKVDVLGLTGGVAIDVRPTGGRTRGGG